MENKASFDVLVQDASAVLNRIIVSEEMAKNSRGIVKVIRFRDWLKTIAPRRPTRPIISGVAMHTSNAIQPFLILSTYSSPPTKSAPDSETVGI